MTEIAEYGSIQVWMFIVGEGYLQKAAFLQVVACRQVKLTIRLTIRQLVEQHGPSLKL